MRTPPSNVGKKSATGGKKRIFMRKN